MAKSARLALFSSLYLYLANNAHAYMPGNGSFVAGNLSVAAPYGIPPDEFESVTEAVFSSATFNMTGYSKSFSRLCHKLTASL